MKLAIHKHAADIYYFAEDDHLHLPLQKHYISTGVEHFDIISLYDHPDKYTLWQQQGLMRKIVATKAGHFAGTPSTVMTFALRRKTLLECAKLFLEGSYTDSSLPFPQDHQLFCELMSRGYSIGTSLPGRSTHCEKTGLSPYIDWVGYAKSLCVQAARANN